MSSSKVVHPTAVVWVSPSMDSFEWQCPHASVTVPVEVLPDGGAQAHWPTGAWIEFYDGKPWDASDGRAWSWDETLIEMLRGVGRTMSNEECRCVPRRAVHA